MLKRIGESKHQAKARAKAFSSAGLNSRKGLGIFSHNTAKNYQATYVRFFTWARELYGITDATQLTSEHAREWLTMNIERNLSYDTLQSYASALEKLPVAFETMNIDHDSNWSSVVQECRDVGKQALSNERKSRAFKEPFRIVEQLTGRYRIAADLQLRCGCRIGEITELKIGRNIVGNNQLVLTNTKGGLVRTVTVPAQLYNQLNNVINEHGVFRIDQKSYALELKHVAKQLGERWSGTHSLRWNYARNEMFRLEMQKNMSFDQARYAVSRSMGHRRPEITEWYLR
jgi:integrase